MDTRGQSPGMLQSNGHEEKSHERRVHVRVKIWNLRLRICGLGFRVEDLGFGVWSLGFGGWGVGFRV